MPISKRINNLTLTSQSLGEQETASAHNGLNGNVAINNFMAINNPGVQSQHYAHQTLMHNYANNVPPHQHQQYYNQGHIQSGQMPPQHHQHQQQQHQNFHQSHIVQSANHSNGFQNGSHLAGTKPNQPHHQHMHQPQSHHHHHHQEANNNSNLINNNNDETYSPELTADENPFYYDKNKLLFDLHVERQRRHQSSH